jgi:hypothetical protein
MEAYPFIVQPPNAIERQQLLVDRVFADHPTDMGAPIILENGRLSRGALMRAKLSLEATRNLTATWALSEDLSRMGFLEPWPLKFDLAPGRAIERLDLFVLSAARLGQASLYRLIETHGPEVGVFLGIHRISLFRINSLLQLAKAEARRKRAEGETSSQINPSEASV